MCDCPNRNQEGLDKTGPLRYVQQLIQKLRDGRYPTEATRCFCGSEPNDTVITEFDRYLIPHRMVMCERCLLIRANPRMTAEAYNQFYNDEYRKIYDGIPYQAKSEDEEFLLEIAIDKGRQLKAFLIERDMHPKVVVDIGSDKGGMLIPFKDSGAEVWGVELCCNGRVSALKRGIESFRKIEELAACGVKADLVIMQDIIEHFTDLNEIGKLQSILAQKGRIFIYTPGLLAIDPHSAFQNAHTYQFIGATLECVMERFGFTEEYLDDHIVSIWRYMGEPVFDPEYPLEWRKQIVEHLQQVQPRSLPPIRTKCKFSEQSMLDNVKENLALKIPTISELRGKYSGHCVIVAGGPSVDGQIDKIRELTGKGHALMVIERMYPWCHKHGLKPTFVVQLDASDDVVEGFTHINPDTIHLVASSTNPEVFKILKGYKQYIWSGVSGAHPDAQDTWHKNGYGRNIIVSTGGSVALASMTIAEVLGFRNIHMFGCDFMIPNKEKTYAADIAGEGVDRSYLEVEIGRGGERVLTCTAFLAFAQQFFRMTEIARRWGMLDTIDIYGESLITKMWDKSEGEWLPDQQQISL